MPLPSLRHQPFALLIWVSACPARRRVARGVRSGRESGDELQTSHMLSDPVLDTAARKDVILNGAAAFQKVHPLQFHQAFLSRGVRSDGRGLLRARHALANARIITSADGSSMVKLGRTTVLAGVRAQPTLPSETEPGLGRVVIVLELAPTCTTLSSAAMRGSAAQHRLEREQVRRPATCAQALEARAPDSSRSKLLRLPCASSCSARPRAASLR